MDDVKAAAERYRRYIDYRDGESDDNPYSKLDEVDVLNDADIIFRAYLRSPPRGLFDEMYEALKNLVGDIDPDNECTEPCPHCDGADVLARAAAWRKEVGG